MFLTISLLVVSWDVLQIYHPGDFVPPQHLMDCIVGKNTVSNSLGIEMRNLFKYRIYKEKKMVRA